jgi:hypothetical protein
MKNIIAGLILLILGGFLLGYPKIVVRVQVWSQRAIMGAQYVPSQRTYAVVRVIGVFLIILGFVVVAGILK